MIQLDTLMENLGISFIFRPSCRCRTVENKSTRMIQLGSLMEKFRNKFLVFRFDNFVSYFFVLPDKENHDSSIKALSSRLNITDSNRFNSLPT